MQVLESAVYQMLLCMAYDQEVNGGECKFGPPKFHEVMSEFKGEGYQPMLVNDSVDISKRMDTA